MEKIEKWSEKKAQIQAQNTKKEEGNMEKEAKNTVKVNKNNVKEEKKMEKSAIIDDRTPETSAKTKELNKKGGDKGKKPTKETKKPSKSTKKPKKGANEMTHKEQLIKVLEDTAKKNKDLEVRVLNDRAGVPSTFRLMRGTEIIVTIRKTDVVAYRPRDFFAKALIESAPVYKVMLKGVEGFTHFTHFKLHIIPETLEKVVAKAITSKKTKSEWKKECKAVNKSILKKEGAEKKPGKLTVSDIQKQEAKLKKELAALQSAKAKLAKPKAKKKASKKASPAIAKVAEAATA